MMVLIAHLRMARFFSATVQLDRRPRAPAGAAARRRRLRQRRLSALFVNDTICLVFTPVLIELARARGHRPLPYLLALATGANIGSVATITGNPQNMLIASLSQISLRRLPLRARAGGALRPGARRGGAGAAVPPRARTPGRSSRGATAATDPPRDDDQGTGRHRLRARRLPHGQRPGARRRRRAPPRCSSPGASTRRRSTARSTGTCSSSSSACSSSSAASSRSAWRQRLFELLAPIGLHTIAGLSVVTAIVSNVISNVPAVMLLSRLVPQLPDPASSWLTLAMASTLAGNLTLVGSIANLIVLEGARRQGVEIGFWQYCKVGVPVTLTTLVAGTVWLVLRF